MIKNIFVLAILITQFSLYLQTQIKILDSQSQFDESIQINEPITGKQADFGVLTFEDYHRNNFIGKIDIPDNSKETQYTGCFPYNVKSPVVVVRRGDCYFYQKAEQAQLAGAKFLIIVDNQEEDVEYLSLVNNTTQKHYKLGIVLIPKEVGEKLITQIEQGTDNGNSLSVSIKLESVKVSEKVKVDYIFTTLQPYSYDTLESLHNFIAHAQNYENLLEKYLEVNIHTPVVGLTQEDINNNLGFENSNCILSGKYCSVDPDLELGPLVGQDTMEYDVKFLCIKKLFGLDKFLQVAKKFHFQCLGPNHEILQNTDSKYEIKDCFEKVIQQSTSLLGFDSKALEDIQQCHDKSFYGSGKQRANTILEEQKDFYLNIQYYTWPLFIVNDVQIHGDIRSDEEITGVICSAYKPTPKFCDQILYDSIPEIAIDYVPEENRHVSIIVSIVAIAVILAILVLLFIRKKLFNERKHELQSYVNEQMSNYLSMRDDTQN